MVERHESFVAIPFPPESVMQTISASWDDISCNRTIEMDVTCHINDNDVSIKTITPTRVITRCDAGETQRIIGVHTSAGQRHLLNKIDMDSIRNIAEREMAIALR